MNYNAYNPSVATREQNGEQWQKWLTPEGLESFEKAKTEISPQQRAKEGNFIGSKAAWLAYNTKPDSFGEELKDELLPVVGILTMPAMAPEFQALITADVVMEGVPDAEKEPEKAAANHAYQTASQPNRRDFTLAA